MTMQEDRNKEESDKFIALRVGGEHYDENDQHTLVLFAHHPEIHAELVGLRDMLNKVINQSARPTTSQDAEAEQDLARVKQIIDRHHAAGWLLGYHHEDMDGFVYRYADGHYEARAEQEAA